MPVQRNEWLTCYAPPSRGVQQYLHTLVKLEVKEHVEYAAYGLLHLHQPALRNNANRQPAHSTGHSIATHLRQLPVRRVHAVRSSLPHLKQRDQLGRQLVQPRVASYIMSPVSARGTKTQNMTIPSTRPTRPLPSKGTPFSSHSAGMEHSISVKINGRPNIPLPHGVKKQEPNEDRNPAPSTPPTHPCCRLVRQDILAISAKRSSPAPAPSATQRQTGE